MKKNVATINDLTDEIEKIPTAFIGGKCPIESTIGIKFPD